MNYSFLTLKERDIETKLDYFLARYYSSMQGRFTSPDVPFADQWEADPQSWNLYTYVGNRPLTHTDPFGLWKKVDCDNGGQCWQAEDGDTWETFSEATGYRESGLKAFFVGETITSGQVFDVGGYEGWTRSLDNQFLGAVYRSPMPRFEPGIGGGLRNVTRSGPSLISRVASWLGLGKKGAAFAGGVTREAIEAAASDPGPTIQVVTRLTQAPGVGRALSVATGEGAEALANAARSGGQVYRANIPIALIKTLEKAGLVRESVTQMGGVTAREYRFLPEAAEFVSRFFR